MSDSKFRPWSEWSCNGVPNLQTKFSTNNLKQAAVYQKRHYDLKAKKHLFKKGQPVWTYEPARKVGICNKLTSPWKGPFIIEKQIGDVTYRVKKSARQPSIMYHVDRLALYQGRNIASWAARFMKNQLNYIQISRRDDYFELRFRHQYVGCVLPLPHRKDYFSSVVLKLLLFFLMMNSIFHV
jgi:hypothetical protein